MKSKLKLLAICHFLFAICLSASAQGTAFTYQGRLNDNGAPANGTYDLVFTIYASASGTNDGFANQTNSATLVTNGLFTVTLNLGLPGIFTGPDRWLEIDARTNGNGAFTTLTPRQKLTPTPYSIFAENVSPDGLTAGTYGSAVTFNNPANNFVGNGSGLTTVNALTLGGVSSNGFWRTAGNAGTIPGANFLGTTDNQALEFQVNGMRGLRIEPNGTAAPNIIGGYSQNSAGGFHAVAIAGGGTSASLNQATGDYAFVGSGHGAQAGSFSAIVDGGYNIATGQFSFIGSGLRITNLADFSFIGTGTNNYIALGANNSFIGGGTLNSNLADSAVITGGTRNLASGSAAFVGGGANNASENFNTVISGGANNIASANAATVGGGSENNASGDHGTIGGGQGNISSYNSTTVSGGSQNTASDDHSTVGGGGGNLSGGPYGTIGGGANNSASGSFATVPGGFLNSAAGNNSFAAGTQAKANHQGTFVWADSYQADFASTTNDQFLARALGGVGIFTGVSGNQPFNPGLRVTDGVNGNINFQSLGGGNTGYQTINFNGFYNGAEQRYNSNKTRWRLVVDQRSTADLMTIDNLNGSTVSNFVAILTNGFVGIGTTAPTNKLHVLGGATFTSGAGGANQTVVWTPGGASWSFTSDRNTKDRVQPVDTQSVLEKVSHLPIAEWSYIGYDQRHIGPMAQDFHEQFPLNSSDKALNDADLHGVALAAIKGLNEKVEAEGQKSDVRIQKLEAENAELKQKNGSLEKRLVALEQIILSQKSN